MSSLPHRFTITVDGKHIAKPEQKSEELFQAETGNEPAVFELQGDHLVSGDFTLGRWIIENKSLQPKPLMWHKNDEASEKLQPVKVKDGANGPEISFGNNSGLVVHDDKVFAPLIEDEAQRVEIHAAEN
ncbi:hypothetical protein FLONG3_5144 [Fusarium longipes]|uniref:Uncharacterized protein n=1 Tax=Fusarium longipes TaxID=694270 RepID=A0A395SW31_9HYPO|nr:hypothetical protein FLONG3_5144 [Fusarium longipes]